MATATSIRYLDTAPLAASVYCQLYSDVCAAIGKIAGVSDPISKIWIIGIDECVFSVVCNNDDAQAGITLLLDFDELSTDVSLAVYSRMLQFNFSNAAATGALQGAMFAVNPAEQCAMLIRKIPLDQLNGGMLVGTMEALAGFAHEFRTLTQQPPADAQMAQVAWDSGNIALAISQMMGSSESVSPQLHPLRA